jgi:hypothetical protein
MKAVSATMLIMTPLGRFTDRSPRTATSALAGALPDEPTDTSVRSIQDVARKVADSHRDDDGMCLGCQISFGQLKPYPCEQRRWADVVAQAVVNGGASRG